MWKGIANVTQDLLEKIAVTRTVMDMELA